MLKKILFFVCFGLALQVRSAPRDLADEARQELENLKSIVKGTQANSYISLPTLHFDFMSNSQTTIVYSTISIQREHDVINQQLQMIKDLAIAAGADITPCTESREDLLNLLPQEYTDDLRTCVFDLNREMAGLVSSAKSVIDNADNIVNNLEWRLNQCDGDLLCISLLLTETEVDKIRLPENIRTEVIALKQLLTNLKIIVKDCGQNNVARYASDANALLHAITQCANDIIG